MASSLRTMPGHYDSARSAPHDPTWYLEHGSGGPLALGPWTTDGCVYVSDLRRRRPAAGALARIDRALASLRADASSAARRLLMAPGGGGLCDRRPHVTGGGWMAPGSGVVFYVARCPATTRRWLCANVYG